MPNTEQQIKEQRLFGEELDRRLKELEEKKEPLIEEPKPYRDKVLNEAGELTHLYLDDELLPIRSGYVDRGDPSSADFDDANEDFVLDNTWNDLDLSSIVPAGIKAVHLGGYIRTAAVGNVFQVREKGNSSTWNIASIRIQVANVYIDFEFVVSVDSDRYIQYKGTEVNFTALRLTVKGWFK